MKRDLKINYGILDDIINQLGIYKRSLSDMESSLSTITTYIEQNRGESIEEWKEKMKGSKEQMADYETQINDLLNLFQGYVDDTTAYITPLQRNAMMRVDRNDIYWNLNQMESGIRNNVPKAISRTYKSPSFWGFWEDVTDTEKEASSINKSKIASIRSDIEQTNNRLNHKMDQLWDLYNSKVKKYENMDDEYNNKASVLKAKYTNFFEGFWDSLESDFNFVKDLVVGIFTGLIDIVVGLATLVFDAGIVAVSNQIPDIIEPKFLKDAANERIDNFYTMVQQIVEDPFSVVEGIGQSFSDSVEEDGIVYVTGNFAAGFVPVVGWSKYARIGKVLDTDKPKKSVNKTANKEGKMVDPVELLLVNAKKVGIEFTSGVINGMRIFKELLQNRNVNYALEGGPSGGDIYRVINNSDDTGRRSYADIIDDRDRSKLLGDVPRIPEIEVKFKRNPKHDADEFERQLKDQEEGINSLTVDEFIRNRDRYLKDGRALEGDAAQKLARKKALQDKIDEFREQGLSYKEAVQKANEWIKDKAALHNPDQIAGGNPLVIGGLGDKKVNSSIGSQWKTKIVELDKEIREIAEDMSEKQRKETYLNIKLTN